jgi:hypothetical protein
MRSQRQVLWSWVWTYGSTTPTRFYEVAWTSFEPDAEKPTALNAEEARLAALEAVDRVDELDVPEDTVERRVLVAWQ